MRAFPRFIAIAATTLSLILGALAPQTASAATPDQQCLAMPTATDQFACLVWIHPGFEDWLLWHAPYTPIGGPWVCIRTREPGGQYAENTHNGYTGAYQFTPGTWVHSVVGAGFPSYANGGRADLAPPRVQDAAAVWLQHQDGWAPWGTRWACGV